MWSLRISYCIVLILLLVMQDDKNAYVSKGYLSTSTERDTTVDLATETATND